ncbi:MAG: peroxiredoxin [Rhodospirillaceae bacterium]
MSIEPGQVAPDFTLTTDSGGTVTLSALRGRMVVLYFYPKDDTSGCTKEACAFRDRMTDFSAIDAVIIGVSKDGPKSHDKFKMKYDLPFTLGCDEDTALAQSYEVWVEKSLYGRKYMGMDRATFLINRDGLVQAVWRKVKIDGHVDAVLKAARQS